MKYIRKKVVETTLFDGDINNPEEIKAILRALSDHEIDVSLKIKEIPTFYDKSRIIEVVEDKMKFIFISSTASFVKTVSIKEIESLSVVTNDQILVKNKPNINRWHLLNPTEF